MAGIVGGCGFETTCGIRRQAHFVQRGAEVVVRVGEFGLMTDRLAVTGHGVRQKAQFLKLAAQIVVALRGFGFQADRLLMAGGGIFGSALQIQNQA